MKILVIEENILLANSIKNLLESNGFYTDLIYDGTEGQEYLGCAMAEVASTTLE